MVLISSYKIVLCVFFLSQSNSSVCQMYRKGFTCFSSIYIPPIFFFGPKTLVSFQYQPRRHNDIVIKPDTFIFILRKKDTLCVPKTSQFETIFLHMCERCGNEPRDSPLFFPNLHFSNGCSASKNIN